MEQYLSLQQQLRVEHPLNAGHIRHNSGDTQQVVMRQQLVIPDGGHGGAVGQGAALGQGAAVGQGVAVGQGAAAGQGAAVGQRVAVGLGNAFGLGAAGQSASVGQGTVGSHDWDNLMGE